jgi:hypothetical protein
VDFRRVQGHTPAMPNAIKVVLLAAITLSAAVASNQAAAPSPGSAPEYTKEGRMKLPERYREWIYLSTGFDMSYTPAQTPDHHMFDSVFVNPEAYRSFVETGTWPDKTMLVLESRGARSKGSINQSGNYQDTELMGLEVHVKDESRFAGKWAFFGFGDGPTGQMIPTSAACYSCHAAHGAVDTTFVQFYPTLLPIANSKGTLSASYDNDKENSRKAKRENENKAK